MSAFMQFEVFGQPQPQGSSRAFVNKKTGRAIVTSSNPNLKDWRDLIAREARDQMNGLPPLDGAVTVNATFFLPRRPDREARPRQALARRPRRPHQHRLSRRRPSGERKRPKAVRERDHSSSVRAD
jgi:Holliday junction resolvase RusA-like endonuclease